MSYSFYHLESVSVRPKRCWRLFLLSVLIFSSTGIFNTITTILAQVLTAQGYTEDDAGWMGALIIGFGLAGAIAAALIADKWHRYNEMVKVIFAIATGACIFFTLVARPGQPAVIAVSLALFGISAFGILPTAIELAVELSYPVPEGTSAGFMWMSGQIFGIIMIFVCGAMRNPDVRLLFSSPPRQV